MGISYDFEKKIEWSIRGIEDFQEERAFRIVENEFPINNSIVSISKNHNEGFICKIFLDKLFNSTYNNNIKNFGIFEPIVLNRSGHTYFINNNSVISVSLTLSNPQVITLLLNKFQSGRTEDFDDKKQRLIIPTETEPSFVNIEANSVKISTIITCSGLIQININGFNYHLFKYKNKDTGKKYLCIDAQEKNKFQEFITNSNAIVMALGYLSGNLYLDEYYYQTFKEDSYELTEHIFYENREKSALTEHALLNTFLFQTYLYEIEKKGKYQNILSYMPKSVFSNLCYTIKTNESYSRCCELVIEGNQCKQLLLRAGIYSIALETITNIIYEEHKEKINPIEDKKLVKILQKKFNDIISDYDEFISEDGKRTLKSKINDMNKPTNTQKLSFPFKIYNLQLSNEDLKMLKHRNKFLHGTSPIIESEIKHETDELIYIVASLHFMLNSLMLKYIGYSGHIINYPTWIQHNSGKEITDHFFRII